MADKDINIHVRAKGTEKAKSDLDSIAHSGKGVGDSTAKGQNRAASATDKADKKLQKQRSTFDSLKGKVLGYITAAVGIERLISMFSRLLEKLQAIQKIQSELYNQSLTPLALGQILEGQTGTSGAQQMWAKRLLELQKAGAMSSPQAAQQMMVAGDIAFGPHGGIKNPKIRELLKAIAPMMGAEQMSGEEVGKFFEFAGTAGISPDAGSYKEFFTQMKAGSAASKAPTLGSFVVGMQKGATPYLNFGGSLQEAISMYTATRSVTANESLAATAQEQMTRMASGGNAKFTEAIQSALGIDFTQMSMDARNAAMLRYVASIPQSKRAATLVEQGVPQEIVGILSSMTGQVATDTLASTRQKVASVDTAETDESTEAFMSSPLGRAKVAEANRKLLEFAAGTGYASWSERKKTAETKHRILAARGEDALTIPDKWEPSIMALDDLVADYKALYESAPEDMKEDVYSIYSELATKAGNARHRGLMIGGGFTGRFDAIGQEYTESLQSLRGAANITNINDYSQHFYPSAGDDGRGPRTPLSTR